MRKKLLSLAFLTALAAPILCSAAIRFVSPNPGSAPYTTITAAFNASSTGDTIVVGPGNYNEALGNTSKRIHLIGAGWDVCTWAGYVQLGSTAPSKSVIEGFKFLSGGSYSLYTYSNVDSVTLRRCHVTPANGVLAVYHAAGKLFVTDCVLNAQGNHAWYDQSDANGNAIIRNTVFNALAPWVGHNAITGPNGGTIEIYNCIFTNWVQPFAITGVPQVIGLNNIFWDWNPTAAYGQLPVGSVFEYTAAGGGAPSFPASFSNNISLGSNNPFVSYNDASYYEYGVSNLHLNTNTGGNLCRNAGYPSILDLDSTASDLGIYGGPKPFVDHGVPAYPFALTLTIDNLVEVGDSVNVVSSGRIGPRY
ncbi:MAG: hypothetical protein H6506_03780 [Calditrichaeota bacterium]|nr:hypothetical protein [Calditrichota bacterium]MCB9391753.1 hypothetical protein [Calditrichota bacterium]